MQGPYKVSEDTISYIGNKFWPATWQVFDNLEGLERRHVEIGEQSVYWTHLLKIDAHLNANIHKFFASIGACQVDVPLLTRSISSPGSLDKHPAIVTDVKPFEVPYSELTGGTFLSQSSQLYLEAYIQLGQLGNGVYTLGKSFRNEESDFRHLTEFRHVEYETRCTLDQILNIQEEMILYVLSGLVATCEEELSFFLTEKDFKSLVGLKRPFERLAFKDVFSILYRETQNPKYMPGNEDILNFDAKAEILLTQILANEQPIFVINYPISQIAFYHKISPVNPKFALNADCLFPGYGEIIGSGQRVVNRSDYEQKMEMFHLNTKDYEWYGEIREKYLSNVEHSGFGMGLERFLAAVLRLPSVQNAVAFPRTSRNIRP